MESTSSTSANAKVYHLQGGDFHITYSTAGSLDYQDSKQSLHFDGDHIRVANSDIGQQVSVTLNF